MERTVTVACVQAEPVILNREATIDKLASLAAEAAGAGAQLLVFPEAFLPAYPSSVWRSPAGRPRERPRRSRCWPASRSRFRAPPATGWARSPGSTASGS